MRDGSVENPFNCFPFSLFPLFPSPTQSKGRGNKGKVKKKASDKRDFFSRAAQVISN